MQKNTKTISLAAMIAIIGIASSVIAINQVSNETMQLQSQELVIQTIQGSMDNYTLEELASGTKYAIIGTVKQITPVLIENQVSDQRETVKTVFSDVVVMVQKDLNGNYNEKEITVRIQGGQVDHLKTVAVLMPTFEKNERVLFFVAEKEPNSIWGDNYYVAGLYLGKYNLNDGEATQDITDKKYIESDLVSKIQQVRGNN